MSTVFVNRKLKYFTLKATARSVAAWSALITFLVFLCLFIFPGNALADGLEYRLKAGFVFNFIKFTDFKKNGDDITVCVAGESPLAAFSALNGKSAAGKKVSVKAVNDSTGVSGCEVLFVALDTGNSEGLLKSAGNQTLTIGESDDFLDKGGIIRFFVEDNHLRFEVNKAALDRAGLFMSSRVLRLARIKNI